jgi:hypothetical protein
MLAAQTVQMLHVLGAAAARNTFIWATASPASAVTVPVWVSTQTMLNSAGLYQASISASIDRRGAREFHCLPDLAHRRRIATLLDRVGDAGQSFPLPVGEAVGTGRMPGGRPMGR